ncbi:MAG: hypothetical protein AB1736_11535 [Chloroflexota bacterium]
METRTTEQRGMVVLGGLLLLLGGLALAGRALDIDLFAVGWPLLVVVPGLLLFAFALSVGGPSGAALAVPGGIVTMVGVVLAVQDATGLWATWAYAWALVAPGGVGIALLAYGIVTGQREIARAGLPILATGLALFLGFGLFFEGVLGLNGSAIAGAETLLAGGIVILGLILVAGGFLGRRRA